MCGGLSMRDDLAFKTTLTGGLYKEVIGLSRCGRVTHICVSKLATIGSDQATSHYLNQCWNIVNSTRRSKLQWNFNRNSNIFIEENTFEDVLCEMVSISSRPQCVIHCNLTFKVVLIRQREGLAGRGCRMGPLGCRGNSAESDDLIYSNGYRDLTTHHLQWHNMMRSSHGFMFLITGTLCRDA